MLKRIGLVGVALALSMVAGCQSPWDVIQSADPNPLRNEKQFGLRPVEMKGLMVDDRTEENFKATKSPEQIRNWEGDKTAINELFARGLTEEAGKAGIVVSPESTNSTNFTIEPTVILVDNGYYRIPAWSAISRIKMRVIIAGPDGKAVDEIVIQGSEEFEIITAASGTRLRNIAERLGRKCGKYLQKRTAG